MDGCTYFVYVIIYFVLNKEYNFVSSGTNKILKQKIRVNLSNANAVLYHAL